MTEPREKRHVPTDTLVLIGAAATLLVGILILIYIRRNPSTAPSHLTVLSVVAGLLMGITTNVGTYYLLKAVDQVSDMVSIDPIRGQVTPGKSFNVSGRATIVDDHELWLVVYRPSGGFDIDSRSAIPIASDGTWIFGPVVVGRPPPAPGQPSPDSGYTYTVAAVIVDKDGADALKQAVRSSNPNDSPFVDGRPTGLIANSTTPVTLP